MFEDHLKGGGLSIVKTTKLAISLPWFCRDVQENDSTLARKQTPVAS